MPEKALVSVVSEYVPDQSDPEQNRFVFSYQITIENISTEILQLMSRHWIIKDANSRIEEVVGEGVVGEQPVILPGESFSYSSGAILETEIGTMAGRYLMRSNNSDQDIPVTIPSFVLSIPRMVH